MIICKFDTLFKILFAQSSSVLLVQCSVLHFNPIPSYPIAHSFRKDVGTYVHFILFNLLHHCLSSPKMSTASKIICVN